MNDFTLMFVFNKCFVIVLANSDRHYAGHRFDTSVDSRQETLYLSSILYLSLNSKKLCNLFNLCNICNICNLCNLCFPSYCDLTLICRDSSVLLAHCSVVAAVSKFLQVNKILRTWTFYPIFAGAAQGGVLGQQGVALAWRLLPRCHRVLGARLHWQGGDNVEKRNMSWLPTFQGEHAWRPPSNVHRPPRALLSDRRHWGVCHLPQWSRKRPGGRRHHTESRP